MMERIHEWNLVRMPLAVSLSTLTQDTLSSAVKLTAKYRLRVWKSLNLGGRWLKVDHQTLLYGTLNWSGCAVVDNIDLNSKVEKLEQMLGRLDRFCVAFSGGVDSTFLLAVARKAHPRQLLAVTIASEFVTQKEVAFSQQMAAQLKVEHLVLNCDVLKYSQIPANPPDRCYHCKKALFSQIVDEIRNRGIEYLLHAVNLDDLGDYRPGLKAAEELGVQSPLVDAGFTKKDIRIASKQMGLVTWNKPSQSCLATRIPYHERITKETLSKIERAEEVLHDMGFLQVRVRVHGHMARIEVPPAQIGSLVSENVRTRVSRVLKKIGFNHVSIDMDGYRTGKMNDEILTG